MTIEEMKARKRELGLTNERIAELSEVPLGTVQKIFSGETSSPRYNTIRKLENVLQNTSTLGEYDYTTEDRAQVSEPYAYGMDYYIYKKRESQNKNIKISEYAPTSVERRLGVAAGKFKVPDDEFFYNDEITEMFEGV